MVYWFVDQLASWLVGQLVDWLVGWPGHGSGVVV
jgi:hypothetical protein